MRLLLILTTFLYVLSAQAQSGPNQFTSSRDIILTALGPMTITNKSAYKESSKGLAYNVSRTDGTYRLEYLKDLDRNWSAAEVTLIPDGKGGHAGEAQVAFFNSSNQPQSLSQCEATDVHSAGISVASGLDRKSMNLTACTTANVEICTEVAKLGALNAEQLNEKMNSCHTLNQVQAKLGQLMRERSYLRESGRALKILTDVYDKVLRPDPTIANRILDSKTVKSAQAPNNLQIDLQTNATKDQTVKGLFKSCQKFLEVTPALSRTSAVTPFDDKRGSF